MNRVVPEKEKCNSRLGGTGTVHPKIKTTVYSNIQYMSGAVTAPQKNSSTAEATCSFYNPSFQFQQLIPAHWNW